MRTRAVLLILLAASLGANALLWKHWERTRAAARTAEKRAEQAESRLQEHGDSRVLLDADEIGRLKALGLTDPVNQLRSDLSAHGNLIPIPAVLGGTMNFYDREGVVLLPGRYVYAPADDGHIVAHTLLQYDVEPGGTIHWKLLDAKRD